MANYFLIYCVDGGHVHIAQIMHYGVAVGLLTHEEADFAVCSFHVVLLVSVA